MQYTQLKHQDSLDEPLDLEHQSLVPPKERGKQASNEQHTGLSSMHQDDGLEYKEWRSPWYCCLGECSLTDWLACCVVANVPCLAFGWNQERAFKMSWWKEGFRYLAATLVVTGMIFTANHRDLGAASLAVLFMVVFAVLMCSRWWATRRGMLRTNFNIKGTNWGDWCLWLWCPSCALCQETRTLMHNRVEEGVWHGPPCIAEMS